MPKKVREKISKTMKEKGIKPSKKANLKALETRRRLYKEGKIVVWNKRKKLSKKHKKNLSKAKKGKKISEEHRQNIIKALKKRIVSSKTKSKISNKLKGHPVSKITRQKISEARKKQRFPSNNTKPELKFMSLIKKYNLPYKYVGDGKFWIENINPDFVDCNGEKVAVEIFGDYWHDPSKKKNLKWSNTEEGRKKILSKYGWKCIVIWEKELKDLSDDEILNKINGGLEK